MLEVKRYGEAHGIEKLTTDTWAAEEVDGWEMTAIAAYVLQAQGAYRSPKSNGFTFMVFTGLRFAEESDQGQQGVAPQSATRSESDSEGGDKPQPESEARSR